MAEEPSIYLTQDDLDRLFDLVETYGVGRQCRPAAEAGERAGAGGGRVARRDPEGRGDDELARRLRGRDDRRAARDHAGLSEACRHRERQGFGAGAGRHRPARDAGGTDHRLGAAQRQEAPLQGGRGAVPGRLACRRAAGLHPAAPERAERDRPEPRPACASTPSSSAPGRPAAARGAARRSRHEGGRHRARTASAAPASIPAAYPPRRWSRAPMRRTWRGAARTTACGCRVPVQVDMQPGQGAQGCDRRAVARRRRATGCADLQAAPCSRRTPASRVATRLGSTTARCCEAERIFINVGGAGGGAADAGGSTTVPFLTNSSMMDVDFVPEHLVIVGGSYIGLEFAQMFRRFGSAVTMVEKGERLIPREDVDVSLTIHHILEEEGVQHPPERANASASEGCRRRRRGRPGLREIPRAPYRGSHLLLAVGRRPNTDDLDLEKAGRRNRRARLHHRRRAACRPACRASLRSATATGAAPSPTPPTTIMRSSPTTCSTAPTGGSATGSWPMASSSIRRSAGRHDRGAGRGHPAARR